MSGEIERKWLYTADPPQRYLGKHYSYYLRRGGVVLLEDFISGFVAGGENHHDMARFFFFCLTFDQLVREGVDGDLVELGAYKGHTATLLAKMARKLGRTAYILDTFTGFDPADVVGIDASVNVTHFRDTSLEAVRALVGEDNVRYVKGRFPQTAGQLPADGRYCLVHIDCDLYAPILSALQYFYPRVVPGGFLIIHDYSSPSWNGADKAVDEFFADKAEAPVPLPDSAGSVVVRKARLPDPADTWLVRKRAALLSFDWASAGNAGLRELLGNGWSGPEEWGVWGVGGGHELHLALPRPLPDEVELELDVHVVLAGRRRTQQVDVSAAGKKLATWEFTEQDNRRVRSVRIPIAQSDGTEGGYESVSLLLAPRTTECPKQLAADLNDERPLGVALHRIRRRM
jgi:Macrocin-O-methyltransferase (TylF)